MKVQSTKGGHGRGIEVFTALVAVSRTTLRSSSPASTGFTCIYVNVCMDHLDDSTSRPYQKAFSLSWRPTKNSKAYLGISNMIITIFRTFLPHVYTIWKERDGECRRKS